MVCNIKDTKSGLTAYRTKKQQGYRYPNSSDSIGGKHSTNERKTQQSEGPARLIR
jgi:hypothetical protein